MIELPDNYTVRLVNMPVHQGGMICESPDGHVNVYINARLSSTGQMDAAKHEYKHWLNGDLDNDNDIRQAEVRAGHKNKRRLLATLKLASELTPPTKHQQYDDWKDDVLHKLGYWE